MKNTDIVNCKVTDTKKWSSELGEKTVVEITAPEQKKKGEKKKGKK